MAEIIAEADCPACGEMMMFETLGEKPCLCGEMIGELTVEWKAVENNDC